MTTFKSLSEATLAMLATQRRACQWAIDNDFGWYVRPAIADQQDIDRAVTHIRQVQDQVMRGRSWSNFIERFVQLAEAYWCDPVLQSYRDDALRYAASQHWVVAEGMFTDLNDRFVR